MPILKKSVALLVIVCMMFSLLVGCGERTAEDNATSATPTAETVTEEETVSAPVQLTVFANGKSDYKIVFAKGSEYSGLSGIASSIRTLGASFGASVRMVRNL